MALGRLIRWLAARRAAGRALAAGEYWVHWTYAPQEWARFAQAERAESRRSARRLLRLGVLLGAGGAAFLLLFNWAEGGLSSAQLAGAIALSGGGPLAVLAAVALMVERQGAAVYRRRCRGRAEAMIGPRGARVQGDSVFPWTGVPQVEEEPGLLVFRSPEGAGLRVPVPAGREAEAAALAQRFTSPGSPPCPTAR